MFEAQTENMMRMLRTVFDSAELNRALAHYADGGAEPAPISVGPLVTDWVSTGAALGSLVAVAATAIIAIKTLNAAKKDSRMRSRPMMYARFTPTPLGNRQVDLEIGNAGAGMAKNVSVTFAPPELILPEDPREPGVAKVLRRRYQNRFATWVPNERHRTAYFIGDHQERRNNLEPLPDELTVIIDYQDDEMRPYRDEFRLDVVPVLQETRVTNRKSGKNDAEQPWGRYVTEALETIARQMR